MLLIMAIKLIHQDLVRITQSQLLHTAGSSLVSIFIPLLLLNQGLELYQVCLFYVAYALIKILINYPATLVINRHGARIGLSVGYSVSFLFVLLLTAFISTGTLLLLYLMPLAKALQNSFLWNSQHLHISNAMNEARKGQDLATIANLKRVASIFAPMIGGFIAVSFGEVWLAGLAAAVIGLSIIPALKIHDTHTVHKLEYSLRNAPVRDLIANVGFNFHGAVGLMVWPIYLAVFIPNFDDIGIITTISTAFGVIVLQIIGRRGDKGKSHQVLLEGTAAASLAHAGRVLASSNPLTITVVTALYDLAIDYQMNPWVSLYYSHTRRRGINYIMSMEIAGDATYVLLWSLLGVVSYVSHDTTFFNVAFFSAAGFAWLCMLMTRDQFKAKLA